MHCNVNFAIQHILFAPLLIATENNQIELDISVPRHPACTLARRICLDFEVTISEDLTLSSTKRKLVLGMSTCGACMNW